MKTPPPIRRLFFDIETSPNVVLSWRVGYKIRIDYDNLLKERAIICIGYKWQGDDQAKVVAWDKDQCDKSMLEKFYVELGRADEAVGHNVDSFDMPWVKTRAIFHKLPPFPDTKTVDTLQWARRRLYLNSCRLDYVARFLGIGAKIKTEFGLWKQVLLERNNGALSQMKTYCAQDVVLLEKVWNRLHTYMPVKTHTGVMYGHEKWSCPRCGSERVRKIRRYVTAKGTPQQQMNCKVCRGYFNISDRAREQYEEAKQKTA